MEKEEVGIFGSLEEYSYFAIPSHLAGTGDVHRSEPIVLDSGQEGWLLVQSNQMSLIVECLALTSNGRGVSLQGIGKYGDEYFQATADFDYQLSVCRTLCVE